MTLGLWIDRACDLFFGLAALCFTLGLVLFLFEDQVVRYWWLWSRKDGNPE